MNLHVQIELDVNLQTTRLLPVLCGIPRRVIIVLVAVGRHAGFAFAAGQTLLCFVTCFCECAAWVISCACGGLSGGRLLDGMVVR